MIRSYRHKGVCRRRPACPCCRHGASARYSGPGESVARGFVFTQSSERGIPTHPISGRHEGDADTHHRFCNRSPTAAVHTPWAVGSPGANPARLRCNYEPPLAGSAAVFRRPSVAARCAVEDYAARRRSAVRVGVTSTSRMTNPTTWSVARATRSSRWCSRSGWRRTVASASA